MKLQVSVVHIRNDEQTIARVEYVSPGVVGVDMIEEAFDAGSWRELADAVAQAIKMMEAE